MIASSKPARVLMDFVEENEIEIIFKNVAKHQHELIDLTVFDDDKRCTDLNENFLKCERIYDEVPEQDKPAFLWD